MLYSGDVKPFLEDNEDIGPTLCPKFLSFHDPQTKSKLQVKITATVDWGEPFVRACYNLEGDGPLALESYERVDQIVAKSIYQMLELHVYSREVDQKATFSSTP